MNSERTASAAAIALEAAQLFGATPAKGEPDNRIIWDKEDAIAGIHDAIGILLKALAPDGTQLADERHSILWAMTNLFHAQMQRIDRDIDRFTPRIKELQSAQDGTEVKAVELEQLTEHVKNLNGRSDAFAAVRNHIADTFYLTETGQVWRPRAGSHTSRGKTLTAAAIDARDFLRARKERDIEEHLPDGTLIAVAGGKEADDAQAIWRTLDRTRKKYPDMVLVHGGAPGVERIAGMWADTRGVRQIICRPDWKKHGKAAPFRRNEQLIDTMPKGLIAFPGNGITQNLADRARRHGIPVHNVAA